MDTPFDDKFLADIRGKLEEMRRQLQESAHEALETMRDDTFQREPGDSVDVSNSEQTRSTQLRLKDREQALLYKVDEAIQRFDSGEYGYCSSCGDAIARKRLLARPVTTMCIECKEEEELEERKNRVTPTSFDEPY